MADPSPSVRIAPESGVSWRANSSAQVLLSASASSPQSLLAQRLADAWNSERRLRAEELLATAEAKGLEAGAAVRVIFEEICLREEDGEPLVEQEYFDRFPEFRSELVRLFECQGLVGDRPVRFPETGETFGEFHLERELGRGAQGRVFLAIQRDLAHRQLVLKFSPIRGQEHLSLARVQHTNIVPIYFAQEEAERNLRVFSMPYLGGATLTQLMQSLIEKPPPQRTGADLAALLSKSIPVAGRAVDSRPSKLTQLDYTSAILSFGIALADALEYIHQRRLAHLDLKPSNVLITADGDPMLLDFHLAREPVRPDSPPPEWFGGTPEYMPPEHRRTFDAVRNNLPIRDTVDGRADVYALGLVLYEALSGESISDAAGAASSTGRGAASIDAPQFEPLEKRCPWVSPGLSDILAKAMAPEAAARYQTAGDLAEDLRRQREHRPLAGVPNRSWKERWQKWRKRRPSALSLAVLFGLVLATAVSAGAVAWQYDHSQRRLAEDSLKAGRRLADQGRLVEAAEQLALGLTAARSALSGGSALATELEAAHVDVRSRQLLLRLHNLVEHLRFLYSQDRLAPRVVKELEAACREIWNVRDAVLNLPAAASARSPQDAAAQDAAAQDRTQTARTDLSDLAMLWADLAGRDAAGGHARAAGILDEAIAALGANAVLERERALHAREAGLPFREVDEADLRDAVRTGWEHYALGRSLMRENRLDRAQEHLTRAVELAPGNFWANFYQAECAYRQDEFTEALSALKVCVALAPEKAECYYNRGVIHAARRDYVRAIRDFDRALELAPKLVPVLLERGRAHLAAESYREAMADFQAALEAGADPAMAGTEVARTHLAAGDRASARTAVDEALAANPQYEPAIELRQRLSP